MTFQWQNNNGWSSYAPEINQIIVDAKNAGLTSVEVNIPNLGPYIINIAEMRQIQKNNSHRWRRMRFLEPGVQDTRTPLSKSKPRSEKAPQSTFVEVEGNYPCFTVHRNGNFYAVVPDPNGSQVPMMTRVYRLEPDHYSHPNALAVRYDGKWYQLVDRGPYPEEPAPQHHPYGVQGVRRQAEDHYGYQEGGGGHGYPGVRGEERPKAYGHDSRFQNTEESLPRSDSRGGHGHGAELGVSGSKYYPEHTPAPYGQGGGGGGGSSAYFSPAPGEGNNAAANPHRAHTARTNMYSNSIYGGDLPTAYGGVPTAYGHGTGGFSSASRDPFVHHQLPPGGAVDTAHGSSHGSGSQGSSPHGGSPYGPSNAFGGAAVGLASPHAAWSGHEQPRQHTPVMRSPVSNTPTTSSSPDPFASSHSQLQQRAAPSTGFAVQDLSHQMNRLDPFGGRDSPSGAASTSRDLLAGSPAPGGVPTRQGFGPSSAHTPPPQQPYPPSSQGQSIYGPPRAPGGLSSPAKLPLSPVPDRFAPPQPSTPTTVSSQPFLDPSHRAPIPFSPSQLSGSDTLHSPLQDPNASRGASVENFSRPPIIRPSQVSPEPAQIDDHFASPALGRGFQPQSMHQQHQSPQTNTLQDDDFSDFDDSAIRDIPRELHVGHQAGN